MPFRYIDFVVTGTPRSGTTYMTSLLRELGYDCTHERCFDPWHITFAEERPDARIWGDSSWLAVPYLRELPPSTRVIHVVRNPVDAINSIVSTGQLDWPHDYRTFIAHHWYGDRDWWPSKVAESGARFWHDWNAAIDSSGRVDLRIRLETACEQLAELFATIDPDHELDPDAARTISSRVPRDVNTRPHLEGCPLVTLDSLDDRSRDLARRYGYDMES